jgi:FkbM family methyltransferase
MAPRNERSLSPLCEGFHGDRHLQTLVDLLAGRVGAFLETGANVGSTLGYVARRYPLVRCLACEPYEPACTVARAHACVRPGVEVFQERSQEFLARLARDHALLLAAPVLAWLDAHDHGFEWPLRDEVRFLTERCERGFLLIDDFKVPHDERFGFDAYDGRECSFEHVADAIAPGVDYHLYYPAYAEHTSPHHPLRGFGLVQFARAGTELERLDVRLPAVCRHAHSARSRGARAEAAAAFAAGDAAGAARLLRAEIDASPGSAGLWNDLGACLAQLGEGRASLAALAQALQIDAHHAEARANLRDVQRAMHPTSDGRALPIAPGKWGRMVARDPYDDLAALIEVEHPVIVDGGANRGGTVAKLRARFPGAAIHAFEPIPALAEHLRGRFAADPGVRVHAAALGADDGELAFCVNASSATSSALEPSALARRYQAGNVAALERITVPRARLAAAIAGPIDVLKLDLQGLEIEALRGLGAKIADVRVILTEVEFVPLYDGQPLFADVDAHLRGRGFRLFHLYDVWSHPDGQITAGDALYVNERFYAAAGALCRADAT